EAVDAAREYLATDDDDEREELAAKLARFDGDLEPVIRDLSARSFKPVKAGYLPEQHFSVPALLEKHPQDLLYFTVPRDYRPDRSTGLIVFMHGGGNTSSRRAPRYSMNFPEGDVNDDQLGDLFDATGMVAVGPSAPWDEESSYRWCLPEADEYLADVIRECKSRFNIDSERVFLIGHSMGGFGAYHHIQRQPDRFAAIVVNAGSWSLAHLPAFRGTRLCIIQGVHDAVKNERWHYTDIAYARWTDKLLAREKHDYVYFEHDGEHGKGAGKPYIAKFLKSAETLRRDPYFPRVVLASPAGFKRWYSFPVKHNRWLTLDEAVDGKLEYDELIDNAADEFDDWRLEHRKSRRKGASIDAVNRHDNTIVVTTRNVAKFTVWLHPKMVDVHKPVTVVVDGKPRVTTKVKLSLMTALESYERRGDWGLIYPMKIEVEVRR
ncbi:MAG TPA: alpha/beta fold hydrolase, partial [Planctomycetaceae bacterium]